MLHPRFSLGAILLVSRDHPICILFQATYVQQCEQINQNLLGWNESIAILQSCYKIVQIYLVGTQTFKSRPIRPIYRPIYHFWGSTDINITYHFANIIFQHIIRYGPKYRPIWPISSPICPAIQNDTYITTIIYWIVVK